jgi:NAD-dependent dihydropyrimidine dehydrogenase PreA subunit
MKKLRIANAKPIPVRGEREINMERCAQYLAHLGVDLELVEIHKHDTEDGRRQCRICLDLKPVDVFTFINSTRETKICRPCREKQSIGWNRGMESAQ